MKESAASVGVYFILLQSGECAPRRGRAQLLEPGVALDRFQLRLCLFEKSSAEPALAAAAALAALVDGHGL